MRDRNVKGKQQIFLPLEEEKYEAQTQIPWVQWPEISSWDNHPKANHFL